MIKWGSAVMGHYYVRGRSLDGTNKGASKGGTVRVLSKTAVEGLDKTKRRSANGDVFRELFGTSRSRIYHTVDG